MFELDDFLNTNQPEEAPEWATSDTKRTLYKHVCAEFARIKGLMESGRYLAIKERKIVSRTVAAASDVHYSLLSTRRHPEIHELIIQYNTELEKLWNHLESTKYKVAKKPSKATIEAQLREKTAEVERLTNLRLAEALTAALENQMVDNHRGLVAMIEHQKAEIERLQNRNGELSKQLRHMMTAVDNIKSK